MIRRLAPRILVVATALLAGCHADWVREHPLGCRLDEQRLVRDALYFGRAIPGGGEVDEAAWQRFESDVLGPAFPRGYTVLDAHGHWRGADGTTIGEANRVVILVHADDSVTESRVREVAARYRTIFRQESVLRERAAVCASF
ncbi:DUF3574 domain-containing protein [Dokdonella sp.]|uniref:DUF3574 domain-containing protein n=1 Tax=Dokdonella sp. TaxID=2291710 RepID=UPI003783231D